MREVHGCNWRGIILRVLVEAIVGEEVWDAPGVPAVGFHGGVCVDEGLHGPIVKFVL